MLKIRRSRDRDHLIFNMGIPIPGKHSLYIEMGPWYSPCFYTLKGTHKSPLHPCTTLSRESPRICWGSTEHHLICEEQIHRRNWSSRVGPVSIYKMWLMGNQSLFKACLTNTVSLEQYVCDVVVFYVVLVTITVFVQFCETYTHWWLSARLQ